MPVLPCNSVCVCPSASTKPPNTRRGTCQRQECPRPLHRAPIPWHALCAGVPAAGPQRLRPPAAADPRRGPGLRWGRRRSAALALALALRFARIEPHSDRLCIAWPPGQRRTPASQGDTPASEPNPCLIPRREGDGRCPVLCSASGRRSGGRGWGKCADVCVFLGRGPRGCAPAAPELVCTCFAFSESAMYCPISGAFAIESEPPPDVHRGSPNGRGRLPVLLVRGAVPCLPLVFLFLSPSAARSPPVSPGSGAKSGGCRDGGPLLCASPLGHRVSAAPENHWSIRRTACQRPEAVRRRRAPGSLRLRGRWAVPPGCAGRLPRVACLCVSGARRCVSAVPFVLQAANRTCVLQNISTAAVHSGHVYNFNKCVPAAVRQCPRAARVPRGPRAPPPPPTCRRLEEGRGGGGA